MLTKAQIKRRKAKAAAAACKAAAASGSAVGEEDEEVRSDVSSGDSEPLLRARPPLDFSKDSEFRRSLKLPPRDVEAEIDEIIAQHEALYSQRHETQPGAAPPVSTDAVAARAIDTTQPSSTAATHFVASSLETSKHVEQPAHPSPIPDADGALSRLAALLTSCSIAPHPASLEAALVDIAALREEVAALRAQLAARDAELALLRPNAQ